MKILVFTVASWTDMAGTDESTWSSLLAGYGAEHVANICIRDEWPTNQACSRYFQISENKVIKSIFNRGIQTGKELHAGERGTDMDADLQAHQARYRKMSAKRRYSMLLARELAWKLGRWQTPELDVFLDSFKPDIILHSMTGYIHLNSVVKYAIQRTGAQAAGYIWDDNFTYKQSADFGYKVYRFFQRRSLRKLAAMTKAFFAISPYTKKEADAYFGIDCRLLTKPLNALPIAQRYELTPPLHMIYTGNLLIGRDRSLLRLARALRELNSGGVQCMLDVYTQTELPAGTLTSLLKYGCRVHPAIPQEEALQKQKEADILLFLEDIDGKHAHMARLSFSTKITDYLSCGKCILAIGNRETAPMQYFLEHDAAVVCDSSDAILPGLKMLCKNSNLLNRYAATACKAALRHHHPDNINRIFRETLEELFRAA